MYLTRKLKLGRTDQLDALARRWSLHVSDVPVLRRQAQATRQRVHLRVWLRPPACGIVRTCGAIRNRVPRRVRV